MNPFPNLKNALWAAFMVMTISIPSSSVILPSDRATAWDPGLMSVGGIPNRTAIYTTLQASAYGDGAQNASAGIQAAIDACPAGQVVKLSAGTFTVNNYLLVNKGITLRGAGPDSTILQKTNGAKPRTSPMQPVDPSSYSYDPQPVIIIGPNRWPKVDETTSQNLAADGSQGANSVTLANATGFSAGQFVLLDELSGASWQNTPTGFPSNAKVWQGDRVAWNMHLPMQQWQDDNSYSDATGPYDLNGTTRTLPNAMSWFSRTDRPTCEIKEIASVNGNAVTFTTPLHISYRTSHTAQLTRYTGDNVHVKNAGVEDVTVLGGADGQVRFEAAAYCWARNIENTQWIGEGFAVNNSFRIEIRDSYIHDGSWPEPGGAGYAISFADAASEILVENNISINTCKVMVVRSCGAGSVFGYNYTDDAWDFDTPTWVEVGINASHMAGPHHVLFEGNYSPNADNDYTHGNSIYITFFRNWLSGQRRSFTDAGNVRAAGLAYGSWWFSFIANVLGRQNQMSGWVYEDPAMTGNNADWRDQDIWKLGYDPERWDMYADPLTLSTAIRHGNFDYVNNSIKWDSSISDHTLPNSLYLAAKPAFFGCRTWPWVQPEGATKLYSLPAKDRFEGLDPCGNRVKPDMTGAANKPGLSLRYAPNQFMGTLFISYTLDKTVEVRLAMYDLSGKLVRNLANGMQAAGAHSLFFKRGNLTRGVYLLQLKAGDHMIAIRTLVL